MNISFQKFDDEKTTAVIAEEFLFMKTDSSIFFQILTIKFKKGKLPKKNEFYVRENMQI